MFCFPLKIKYLTKIFINIFQYKDKNMYICKNDKSMEMTATDTFEKQDLFYNRMIEDYKNGAIHIHPFLSLISNGKWANVAMTKSQGKWLI